jgi:hypothetical protein
VPVVEVTPGADQDGVVDDLPQCVIGGDVQLAIGKANQRGATLDLLRRTSGGSGGPYHGLDGAAFVHRLVGQGDVVKRHVAGEHGRWVQGPGQYLVDE